MVGSQGKVTAGLPWNGAFRAQSSFPEEAQAAHGHPHKRESELPGEASSYLAVMCVIILKVDL